MKFDYDLIVPAHTPQNEPVTQRVKLTRGTLTQVVVVFPPGPALLVHVTVSEELHQLVPANPDGDINLDDNNFISDMQYPLENPPYDLIVIGWSPSANYEHTITFQFDVQPLKADDWSEFLKTMFAPMRPPEGE